jgi:hypothetical protein
MGREEVKIQALLTSALDKGKLLASTSGHFALAGRD